MSALYLLFMFYDILLNGYSSRGRSFSLMKPTEVKRDDYVIKCQFGFRRTCRSGSVNHIRIVSVFLIR